MPSALSKRLKTWFAIAAVMLVASFGLRFSMFSRAIDTNRAAAQTREALRQLEGLLSTLKDAETGQRGYLLTGRRTYLEPYERARASLDDDERQLAELLEGEPEQLARLAELRTTIDQKLAELQSTIETFDREGFEAAKAIVIRDRGRDLMSKASAISADMFAAEEAQLVADQARVRSAERLNLINFFGLAAFNLLLLGVLFNVVRLESAKREQAAELIENHELRLRRVVESNMIGIDFFDAQGNISDANEAFLHMLGYRRADIAGGLERQRVTPTEFHERDRQAVAEARMAGRCAPYEKEFVRRDGTRLPALVGVARIDDPGAEFVGFVLDLSERRTAEEVQSRLAAIVESSDDAIMSMTLDGIITTWNAGARRLYGFSPEEAIGQPIDLILPADRHAEEAELLARLGRGERVEHMETVRVAKDGRPIDVSITVSPVRNAAGLIVGASKIARDISARKLAEQERERLLAAERTARAEAERIGRVKDEFLATLSHELRTPLNAILGWTHLLTNGTLSPEETAQGLDIIQRSARAQTQLIEDLLDMSRIISGKLRMDVQTVDLPVIIGAALESVRPAADAKTIRLQRVLDPQAGPVVGDPNRLQQIVWNLLSNAVKFTGKGGRVQVALARVNSHVEITVSDSGCGIATDFLPHVFERFRQADASTTRRHGGLGLGLAIVRHLVESHGGTVTVASQGEGQGATFTVALPLMPFPDRGENLPRTHPRGPSEPAAAALQLPELAGLKVLVVDDEADTRSLIQRLLSDCHATVLLADSVDAALALLSEQQPEVLISDIGMPLEDGYSLLRRVRELPADGGGRIPAVALTAFARSEDRRRALDCGFQIHLSKPVEPAELLSAVANLTGRKMPGAAPQTPAGA